MKEKTWRWIRTNKGNQELLWNWFVECTDSVLLGFGVFEYLDSGNGLWSVRTVDGFGVLST